MDQSCLLSPAGLQLSVLHLLLTRLNLAEVGGAVSVDSRRAVALLKVDFDGKTPNWLWQIFTEFWLLHSIQSHFVMITQESEAAPGVHSGTFKPAGAQEAPDGELRVLKRPESAADQ